MFLFRILLYYITQASRYTRINKLLKWVSSFMVRRFDCYFCCIKRSFRMPDPPLLLNVLVSLTSKRISEKYLKHLQVMWKPGFRDGSPLFRHFSKYIFHTSNMKFLFFLGSLFLILAAPSFHSLIGVSC